MCRVYSNLSDISTPSDSGSEVSDTNDVICLSDIDFDKQVARELGARFIKTNKGTEVVFDESSDKEILRISECTSCWLYGYIFLI